MRRTIKLIMNAGKYKNEATVSTISLMRTNTKLSVTAPIPNEDKLTKHANPIITPTVTVGR
jgi:hypothetical protein